MDSEEQKEIASEGGKVSAESRRDDDLNESERGGSKGGSKGGNSGGNKRGGR